MMAKKGVGPKISLLQQPVKFSPAQVGVRGKFPREHLPPVLQHSDGKAHGLGRRGQGPGHMAAPADHQPNRSRQGLAEAAAWGNSPNFRRSSSAAPGPGGPVPGNFPTGGSGQPAKAAGAPDTIQPPWLHLQWQTASSTPPAMAKALSEIVKTIFPHTRASTSPGLEPGSGHLGALGQNPPETAGDGADHRLTLHQGHRLPGLHPVPDGPQRFKRAGAGGPSTRSMV